MNYTEWADSVNERNCNARLTALYKVRDSVGNRIATLESRGEDVSSLTTTYLDITDCIERMCEFRKTHDCLLQGDPGFGINS